MKTNFWKDKRVCVTGGAGFLGSTITSKLRGLGCGELIVPRSRDFDLRINESIKKLYFETRPQIVVHLAAVVGGIGANSARPAEFLYDNLMMGTQLLHEAWAYGVEKFVAIGTVCAYPKFTSLPFSEDNLWDGYPEETNAPYGLAKKMLLVQSQAYRKQYEFNSIFLLPVNLYGPGDSIDSENSHVIPSLIMKFLDAKLSGQQEVVVWGDGSPTREFLYVDDAADGILLAAEKYNSSHPVNLGSGQEISILDLATTIASLVGYTGKLVWDRTKPNGQPRRRLDISRAQSNFGFKARMDFEDGLKRTVDWYVQRSAESS
ncbi:MAG TPA: GDP-fucose synthetase [Chloroflexi bacterium]|nr:GDP-fucose synthetase [Chloroflexota bacterium]|tara:strand:+ start:856 stop:1809 length:954 start_codon:yes stop_codon:yes gene_type:complete